MENRYNLRRRNNIEEPEKIIITKEIYERQHSPFKKDEREYSTTLKNNFLKYFIPSFLTILSLCTRLYQIDKSNIVVWDSAHFGKFANFYLKGKFYFDVHPNLGKMLIALVGWIFGYDGSFPFESGSVYTNDVPYVQMRSACAIVGSLLIPLTYGICLNFKMKKSSAFMTSLLVLVDNALLTISKFILLDPFLLTFMASSVYFATKLRNESPFSYRWYSSMLATGLSLGAVISVKWVGLFTYVFVGILTIDDLWKLLPILLVNRGKYIKHFAFRTLFLIIVPFMVYVATFAVHFSILNNSGPGDATMSSLFQAGLNGNNLANAPLHVAFGSSITFRNNGYGSGILHSHLHKYPTGSEQQQVTLYSHKDANNFWIVSFPHSATESEKERRLLIDGDIIRLIHNTTLKNLHSHNIPAPFSVYNNEVSCYGNATHGDANDHWILETVDKKSTPLVETLITKFRLKHFVTGCYLQGSHIKLPEWGFKQQQVSCSLMADNDKTIWNIEQHVNEFLPKSEKNLYTNKISFWTNFFDLNMAMWNGNNGLVQNPSKRDLLISKPYQWPLLDVGIRICNWKDDTPKFYLLGNPFLWWTCFGGLIIFITNYITIVIKRQSGILPKKFDDIYLSNGGFLLAGWLLNYIPYVLMPRVLYLHHFFPSLWFSIVLTGLVLDRYSYKNHGIYLFYTVLIGSIGTFIHFSPISYGFVGSSKLLANLVWKSTWNIV